MTDLEEYSVALDMFPNLTTEDRALILTAVEEAPEEYPDTMNIHDKYFDSAAFTAWRRAREVVLSPTYKRWPVDLAEASGYSSVVTKADILTSLHRGHGMVSG